MFFLLLLSEKRGKINTFTPLKLTDFFYGIFAIACRQINCGRVWKSISFRIKIIKIIFYSHFVGIFCLLCQRMAPKVSYKYSYCGFHCIPYCRPYSYCVTDKIQVLVYQYHTIYNIIINIIPLKHKNTLLVHSGRRGEGWTFTNNPSLR